MIIDSADTAIDAEDVLEALADPGKDVLQRLRDMPGEQFRQEWVEIAATLSPTDLEVAKKIVADRLGIGVRAVGKQLTQFIAKRYRAKRDAQFKAQVGERVEVVLREPECSEIAFAEKLEGQMIDHPAARFGLYRNGDMLVRCKLDEQPGAHLIDNPDAPPPKVALLVPYNRFSMQALVESVFAFCTVNMDGERLPAACPITLPQTLLNLPASSAPSIRGLLQHPVVTIDGEFINAPGFDKRTGLLLPNGEQIEGLRPYTLKEARAAYAGLRKWFLSGFEFADEAAGDQALGFLFLAVMRKALDIAPMIAATAPVQSSGKTTLMQRIHAVLTGRDLPVQSMTTDVREFKKVLLSVLIGSPPMVCFDNVFDGGVFGSNALSAAVTSPTYSDRLLGVSEHVRVSTNTVFAVTGNNLQLDAETAERTLEARLISKSARPRERRFDISDVVSDAAARRSDVLCDVLCIVAGYIKAKRPMAGQGVPSRFNQWAALVRDPLLWLGVSDLAVQFSQNMVKAGDQMGAAAVLSALKTAFGEKPFTASQVAAIAENAQTLINVPAEAKEGLRASLIEGLGNLRCSDPKEPRSVGRGLKAMVDRICPVTGLVLRHQTRNVGSVYRIEEPQPWGEPQP